MKPCSASRIGGPVLAATAVSVLLACDPPLKQAQLIESPRVLGARVSGADGKASLQAGQPASFEVLVAGTEGGLVARFAYNVCETRESGRGVPYCSRPAFATGTTELTGAPVAFDVPDSLGDSPFALLGVACIESEPVLAKDPLAWRCSGADSPLGTSFVVRPGSRDFQNNNPDLSELRVRVGRTLVKLEGALDAPTCADGAPEVEAGVTHPVAVLLGDAARELQSADLGLESLQVSLFATRGLFERQFSFIDPDATPKSELTWDAPKSAGPVKQFVVVRDERGGVSWASWSVCAR
jgi:hypothetical protein